MAKVTLGVDDHTLTQLIDILKGLGCEVFDHHTVNSD